MERMTVLNQTSASELEELTNSTDNALLLDTKVESIENEIDNSNSTIIQLSENVTTLYLIINGTIIELFVNGTEITQVENFGQNQTS